MSKFRYQNKIEREYQMQLVEHIKIRYPNVLMFAIPNDGIAGSKGAIYGMIRKKMGVVAGVPDLFLAHPGKNDKRGLFIEMKREGGKVSQAQKEVHHYLKQYYDVKVCYNYEEAIAAVDCYMGSL